MKLDKAIVAAAATVAMLGSTGAGAAKPDGRAWSDGVLIRMQVADTLVQIGMDQLNSIRAKQAQVLWTSGRSGDDEVGRAETKTTGKRQKQSMQAGTVDLGTSLSASITSGGMESVVAGDRALSSFSTRISDASVAFAAEIDAISYDVESVADADESTAIRKIEVSDMVVLRLRDLLDQVGFSILRYTCQEVQTIASNVGVDAGDTCTNLSTAETAIQDAVTLIQGVEAGAIAARDTALADLAAKQAARDTSDTTVAVLTVQRNNLQAASAGLDEATLNATVAALTPLCPTLVGPAKTTCENDLATAQSGLATMAALSATEALLAAEQATLAGLESAITALEATIDSLDSLLALIASVLAGNAPTCDDAKAALQGVAAAAPAAETEATSLIGAIDTACNLLSNTIDDLLDAPLLSVQDLSLDLVASGKKGEAVAVATGSLGALTIGVLPPLELDLVLGSGLEEVQAASNTATGLLRDTLGSLGLDVTDLDLELLRFDHETEVAEDGSSSASTTASILSLDLPSLTVSFPDQDPLAILGGGDAPSVPDGSVTTPPISLDVANFQAASTFPVAAVGGGGGTGGGGSGTTLPVTGVGDDNIFIALSAIFIAATLRRWLQGATA
ncbi:MAG: hypothetical protein ACLGH3_00465 [Actinomycetota bacterium]